MIKTKTGASVEFRGLRREFGDVKALDGLNLLIRPGELVALLGPSGCGKTTALRVLAGLEQADAGEVLVDGSDVVGVPANKRDMGMVFQAYSLFPNLTVLDNVAFGLRLRGQGTATRQQRAGELLELVGLDTHAKRYPHQLSGGQQQRVALARALAIEPRVLLLDEPGERPDGAVVRVLVRPESVTLEAGGPARITDHSFRGAVTRLTAVLPDGTAVLADLPSAAAAELLPGTAADVGFGSRPVLLAADV